MTKLSTNSFASSLVSLLAIFASVRDAHADIFQWEYVNPANPGLGKQQSSLLAPDGAGVSAAPGANLSNRNLTKAYLNNAELSQLLVADEEGQLLYVISANLTAANLSQADLSNTRFYLANLTDANLTDAEVRGATFHGTTAITTAQLYSTSSYKSHDLTGISLGYLNLPLANFAGQNMTNAVFRSATFLNANFHQANLTHADLSSSPNFLVESSNLIGADLSQANLTNADFSGVATYNSGDEPPIISPGANLTGASLSGADARGADFQFATLSGANTSNLIESNGHIAGLELPAGASLLVRDYDGNPFVFPSTGPLPIVVDQHLAMTDTGTLRLEFDADAWDSTISFAPGISVARGGTLELAFSASLDVAAQSGRTIDIFNWTGVNPTGAFAVSSPYSWDLTKLYTTGEVTLLPIADFNGDGHIDGTDLVAWTGGFGLTSGAAVGQGDANRDFDVDGGDFLTWQRQFDGHHAVVPTLIPVPEPKTTAICGVCMVVLIGMRRVRGGEPGA